MKAIIQTSYGSPEALQIKDIEKPSPGKNEVLIKVMATTINDFDWSLITGKPHLYRLLFGLFKPKKPTPGIELAGIVEALGAEVKNLHIGDRVYADISEAGWGSFAEYISVNESTLSLIPEHMSFAEAASIPHAAMLAYQGLVDVANIRKNQKVLVNGAGGGMGSFAVQIAKLYNAEVTGVDSRRKFDMMRSIGYDHLIDYRQTDFTETGDKYDLIIDAKSTRGPATYARALKPNGNYVTVGGHLNRLIQLAIASKTTRKNMHVLALKPNKDLNKISEMYAKGQLKTQIDGPYDFDEIPRLISYFGKGEHLGKIVITVNNER